MRNFRNNGRQNNQDTNIHNTMDEDLHGFFYFGTTTDTQWEVVGDGFGRTGRNLHYAVSRKHQPHCLHYRGTKSDINDVCKTGTAFNDSTVRMRITTFPSRLPTHRAFSWRAHNSLWEVVSFKPPPLQPRDRYWYHLNRRVARFQSRFGLNGDEKKP